MSEMCEICFIQIYSGPCLDRNPVSLFIYYNYKDKNLETLTLPLNLDKLRTHMWDEFGGAFKFGHPLLHHCNLIGRLRMQLLNLDPQVRLTTFTLWCGSGYRKKSNTIKIFSSPGKCLKIKSEKTKKV